MKIILFVIITLISTDVFAQDRYSNSVIWLTEIIRNEPRVNYKVNLGDSYIVFDVDEIRDIEIVDGILKYYKYKPGESKSLLDEFYLIDIDKESIILKERKDIDPRKILYQVWADTKNKLDVITEYTSHWKVNRNHFSVYFENKENASQFIYALKQTVSVAPEKVIKTIEVSPGYMVRNLDWGMTIDKVKALEKAELIEDSSSLKYRDKEFGEDVVVEYMFEYNKLNCISITYVLNYDDDNDFIQKFIALKERYKELYGDPINDKVIWHDKKFKNQKSRYGYAISAGKLHYRTTYRTEYSEHFLNLMGIDGRPSIILGIMKSTRFKK